MHETNISSEQAACDHDSPQWKCLYTCEKYVCENDDADLVRYASVYEHILSEENPRQVIELIYDVAVSVDDAQYFIIVTEQVTQRKNDETERVSIMYWNAASDGGDEGDCVVFDSFEAADSFAQNLCTDVNLPSVKDVLRRPEFTM